jgi:hypothetical protein
MIEGMHHALHRGKSGTDVVTRPGFDVDSDIDIDENGGCIRCPVCEWKPGKSSKWYCGSCPDPEGFLGGCGTSWNTFDTRGLCPGCKHQWRWTSCLVCGVWSPHDEWYVSDNDRHST